MRERCQNPNDHLRAIIRYANSNNVDFVAITGDLVNALNDNDTDNWKMLLWRPWEETNLRHFVKIITGNDGLGEPLQCPLFVVPGNHDYLPFNELLRYDAAGLTTRQGQLEAIGLDEACADLLASYDSYKGRYEVWHDIPVQKAYTFLEPVYPLMSQYLTEINFDPTFTAEVGIHRMVFCNDGEHVGVPGFNLAGAADYLFDASEYVREGAHTAGFGRRIGP